jgi:Domain of unknown function (DUF3841)
VNDKPSKKAAYLWMNAQMRKRGLTISDSDVPLWAFLSLPSGHCWESRPNDQLARIEIPKQRVLIALLDAWRRFLNVAYNPASEYLCANADDKGFLKGRNFQKPDDETCRNSWGKMFNLNLAKTTGFLWPLTLQATIAAFHASDIVEQVGDFP